MGGIFIPSVSVVNVEQLVASLAKDAEAANATLFYSMEVNGIESNGSNFVVHTVNGTKINSRLLVNSAGLKAAEISLMAGGPKYDIEILRGDYYELEGGIARWNIRTLVYPAMPPRSPSKGVHFGPRTDGRLFIGPSATPPEAPMPKELFLQAAVRFLPGISDSDLRWAYFGLRPKHVARNGRPDFVISLDRKAPPLINLIGIDSPGLSASMGIARHVAEMIQGLGL
jgi:glycerol-3-phosphate dehydrogenase